MKNQSNDGVPSQAVRNYLREIGRKGGKAAKGTPARIAANRRAAQARWRKVHPEPKPITSHAWKTYDKGQHFHPEKEF